MGDRGDRRRLTAKKQKESRALNGPKKAAERERRDRRLLAALKIAKPPYGKVLRSWLSGLLEKPEAAVTAEDVQVVLKAGQKPRS